MQKKLYYRKLGYELFIRMLFKWIENVHWDSYLDCIALKMKKIFFSLFFIMTAACFFLFFPLCMILAQYKQLTDDEGRTFEMSNSQRTKFCINHYMLLTYFYHPFWIVANGYIDKMLLHKTTRWKYFNINETNIKPQLYHSNQMYSTVQKLTHNHRSSYRRFWCMIFWRILIIAKVETDDYDSSNVILQW